MARPGMLVLGFVGVAAAVLLAFAASVAVARDPEVPRRTARSLARGLERATLMAAQAREHVGILWAEAREEALAELQSSTPPTSNAPPQMRPRQRPPPPSRPPIRPEWWMLLPSPTMRRSTSRFKPGRGWPSPSLTYDAPQGSSRAQAQRSQRSRFDSPSSISRSAANQSSSSWLGVKPRA